MDCLEVVENLHHLRSSGLDQTFVCKGQVNLEQGYEKLGKMVELASEGRFSLRIEA